MNREDHSPDIKNVFPLSHPSHLITVTPIPFHSTCPHNPYIYKQIVTPHLDLVAISQSQSWLLIIQYCITESLLYRSTLFLTSSQFHKHTSTQMKYLLTSQRQFHCIPFSFAVLHLSILCHHILGHRLGHTTLSQLIHLSQGHRPVPYPQFFMYFHLVVTLSLEPNSQNRHRLATYIIWLTNQRLRGIQN